MNNGKIPGKKTGIFPLPCMELNNSLRRVRSFFCSVTKTPLDFKSVSADLTKPIETRFQQGATNLIRIQPIFNA